MGRTDMGLVLGVDVGVSGAIACLRDGQYFDVEDLPIVTCKSTRWIDAVELAAIIRRWRSAGDGRPVKAVVERIHAMPEMGSVANNSKGSTLGSVLATLQMTGCAIELVEPGTWKRHMGLL